MSKPLPAQLRQLRDHLDTLLITAPTHRWIDNDPIRFPRRIPSADDREIVAIFAALMAYGRVSLIGKAISDAQARMGDRPAQACASDTEDQARTRFKGFVYRVTRGVDLARLWLGLGHLRRTYGSILSALETFDDPKSPDFRPMLKSMRTAVINHTTSFEDRRGFRHFMPDPYGGSAIKRYNMLLRWMIRGPDTIDMGDWSILGTERLMLPLDTHIHQIATKLGLTERTQAGWQTTAEITSVLRKLSPTDPTRYDFALAHLGISGAIDEPEWQKFVSNARIVKHLH